MDAIDQKLKIKDNMLNELAIILIMDFFDNQQLLEFQFIGRKFYDSIIPRAMIRRSWLPKINLYHHLTVHVPQGIPNYLDPIFLKEFELEAPFKVHDWPEKPNYGDVEDREVHEDGWTKYTG